jgi:N-carbamoylputrescine amidase
MDHGDRATAAVSGAFCLSSNPSGPNIANIEFGGTGWVIEPEEENVLGVTSPEKPFLNLEINLETAEKAKHKSPR